MFNDDNDDLDAYLQRFERYATEQGWRQQNWALNLSALLSGKALEVYSTLPITEAQDYAKLKLALLRKYNLTEDGYRMKFKTSKPKQDETAAQYASRLGNYLQKWTEIAKVHKKYKGLCEFVIIDQFMHSVPKDVALFVKERKQVTSTLEDITALADQYIEAHGDKWSNQDKSKQRTSHEQNLKIQSGQVGSTKSENPSSRQKQFKCFYCQKPGHSWRKCTKAPKSFVPNMAMLVDALKTGSSFESENSSQNVSNSNEGQSGCKDCHSETERPEAMAFMKTVLGDNHFDKAVKEGHLELKCGHRIPLIIDPIAACKHAGDQLHTADAYVGQTKVKMLRDTGCEGVVVKATLVPQSAMTGQYKTCMLIDGTIRTFPIAEIEVNTSYFSGKVFAKCMRNPVYDLIIGQGVGAKDPSKSNPNESLTHQAPNVDVHAYHVENASAITRSQAKAKSQTYQPLKVSKPMQDIVTVDTLREEQKNDPTLAKIRDMVETNETKTRKSGSSFRYIKRNGVIFREYQSPNVDHGNDIRQVEAFPLKYRNKVMKLAHESILGGHQGSKNTTDKMLSNFFWPGIKADITRYCQSCNIYQRTVHKGRIT